MDCSRGLLKSHVCSFQHVTVERNRRTEAEEGSVCQMSLGKWTIRQRGGIKLRDVDTTGHLNRMKCDWRSVKWTKTSLQANKQKKAHHRKCLHINEP